MLHHHRVMSIEEKRHVRVFQFLVDRRNGLFTCLQCSCVDYSGDSAKMTAGKFYLQGEIVKTHSLLTINMLCTNHLLLIFVMMVFG